MKKNAKNIISFKDLESGGEFDVLTTGTTSDLFGGIKTPKTKKKVKAKSKKKLKPNINFRMNRAVDFIKFKGECNKFYTSLLKQYRIKGELTKNQIIAVERDYE